jgi:hypothetical protein
MEIWFRTNEFEEAILSLEKVAESSKLILEDPSQWRWVVVALHNAVQGFMVLALRGSNNLAVLSPKSASEWMEAYQNSTTYPKNEKLDTFLNLYKKIKGDRMIQFGYSKKFAPQGSQGWSIKKLNQLRNEFIHFIPKGWSLELSGMPQICVDCLDIISFLGWDSGNVIWCDESLSLRAKEAFELSQKRLSKAKVKYE